MVKRLKEKISKRTMLEFQATQIQIKSVKSFVLGKSTTILTSSKKGKLEFMFPILTLQRAIISMQFFINL